MIGWTENSQLVRRFVWREPGAGSLVKGHHGDLPVAGADRSLCGDRTRSPTSAGTATHLAPPEVESASASRGPDPGRRTCRACPVAVGAVARGLGSGCRLVQAEKVPSWMTAEEYESLPHEIRVRELRYGVEVPGHRVREITLVTTLRDAAAYPAEALADSTSGGGKWRSISGI